MISSIWPKKISDPKVFLDQKKNFRTQNFVKAKASSHPNFLFTQKFLDPKSVWINQVRTGQGQSEHVKSIQVNSNKNRSIQVRIGQVKSCQPNLSEEQVRTDQVKSGQDRSNQGGKKKSMISSSWPNIFVRLKSFWSQNFLTQNFSDLKYFSLEPNFFSAQNYFGSKSFWTRKSDEMQNFWRDTSTMLSKLGF